MELGRPLELEHLRVDLVALARQIAAEHQQRRRGGRLVAHCRENYGSTFTVRLPLKTRPNQRQASPD